VCPLPLIVNKYLPNDKFPTKGNQFVMLARGGWMGTNKLDCLLKLYPECGNKASICGEWIMLREKFGWASMTSLENEAIQSKVSSNWQP
jgi:hypothetical protein